MRLIDADALLLKLQKDPLFPLVEQYGISRVIETATTVDAVEVKHGHWIYKELGYPLSQNFYICSECGYPHGLAIDNYCPHCGAKMDEEEKE